jgi:hypothetical protein
LTATPAAGLSRPVANRTLPELVDQRTSRQARFRETRRLIQRRRDRGLAPSHWPLAFAQHEDGQAIDFRQIDPRAAGRRLQPRPLAEELPTVLPDRFCLHAHPRLRLRQHPVTERERRPTLALAQAQLEDRQLGGIGEDVRGEKPHARERSRREAEFEAIVLALRLVPHGAGNDRRPIHPRAASGEHGRLEP